MKKILFVIVLICVTSCTKYVYVFVPIEPKQPECEKFQEYKEFETIKSDYPPNTIFKIRE